MNAKFMQANNEIKISSFTFGGTFLHTIILTGLKFKEHWDKMLWMTSLCSAQAVGFALGPQKVLVYRLNK